MWVCARVWVCVEMFIHLISAWFKKYSTVTATVMLVDRG